MPPNDLERLVRFIESQLLPEELTITANERIFNADGVQIAEFDLRITGPVGTAEIDWLIECRDRPSEGAAPREWIQQLLGRREDFGFTNVTAVSTTGFSPGAIELAKDRGIDLRSVDSVAPEEFQDWLRVEEIQVEVGKGNMKHARILVDPSLPPEVRDLLDEIVGAADMSTEILVHTETGNHFSLLDAWRDFLNRNPQLFSSYVPGAEPIEVSIHANYTNPESRYKIETESGDADITAIVFVADMSVEQDSVPMASATRYVKVPGDQIAQSAKFEIEIEGEQVELSFHRMGPEGRTIVTVRKSSYEFRT